MCSVVEPTVLPDTVGFGFGVLCVFVTIAMADNECSATIVVVVVVVAINQFAALSRRLYVCLQL